MKETRKKESFEFILFKCTCILEDIYLVDIFVCVVKTLYFCIFFSVEEFHFAASKVKILHSKRLYKIQLHLLFLSKISAKLSLDGLVCKIKDITTFYVSDSLS